MTASADALDALREHKATCPGYLKRWGRYVLAPLGNGHEGYVWKELEGAPTRADVATIVRCPECQRCSVCGLPPMVEKLPYPREAVGTVVCPGYLSHLKQAAERLVESARDRHALRMEVSVEAYGELSRVLEAR